MKEREYVLSNLADYESINHFIGMLKKIHELKKLSESGNQTAHAIWIDLTTAMKSEVLTEKQKEIVWMKYYEKETNTYIAEHYNISETAVRKHLRGATKRMMKLLNN